MIASFRHSFIFLKTHKTASTSIELALTPFCGPADIVAPTGFEDERARMVDGVVQARNYADAATQSRYSSAVAAGDEDEATSILRSLSRRAPYYNHMPAAQLKRNLPREFWSRAFKFSIERHPYEKAVSWAFFDLRTSKAPAIVLLEKLHQAVGKLDDSAIYTIDNKIIVDRMLRYESLESGFAEVLTHLGLPSVDLPRAKGHFRTDRRSARDILTSAQKGQIAAVAKGTFEAFGYLP